MSKSGTSKSGSRIKLLIAALLVGLMLLILTLVGGSDSLIQSEQGLIVKLNQAYLTRVENQSVDALLLLGGLKAVMYTLQSSQVGVSFIVEADVTLGHAIAPITDFISYSISLFTFNLSSILFLEIVLDLAQDFGPDLLLVSLWSSLLYFVVRLIDSCFSLGLLVKISYTITKMVCSLFLVLHLIIPYSTYCSAYLDNAFMHSRKVELHQRLKDFHDDYHGTSEHELSDRADSSMSAFKTLSGGITEKLDLLVRYLCESAVIWIIEILLIPGILFSAQIFLVKVFFEFLEHETEEIESELASLEQERGLSSTCVCLFCTW